MMVSKLATARRSSIAVAGAALTALLLAACGGGSSESTAPAASAGAGAGASTAASAPAEVSPGVAEAQATVGSYTEAIDFGFWPQPAALSAPVDVKGKTIYVIPIGDAVPVINAVRSGLDEAITAAGGTPKFCDGKFNPTEISNCIKLAVDQKADAIVTMFIDYAMVPTAFESAVKAGVPVLVGGAVPSGDRKPGKDLAFFDLSGQSSEMSRITAYAALGTIGDGLNAIVVRLNDSKLTTANGDAAIAAITEACPTCKAIPVDYTTATVDKLPGEISAALVANPEVNAVVVQPEVVMPQVIQAINTAGAQDKIKLFGGNGDVAGLQRVADGTQVADAGISTVYTGWQFANALMQFLAGDEVLPITDYSGGRVFNADNIAGLTLTPEAYKTMEWYGDDSFKQLYLDTWAGVAAQ